jgi:hypothetical protein
MLKEYSHNVNITCHDAPIAVKLTGGLGNHLFGIAAGIDLSIRRSKSTSDLFFIKVDNKDLRADQVNPLSNSLFSQLKFVDSESVLTDIRRNHGGLRKVLFVNPQTVGKDNHWSQRCRHSLEHFLQWADVPCGTAQIVYGYLQNKDFFTLSGPILKRLFAVPEDVSLTMRLKYLWTENERVGTPWAIHIRRGDFLKSNWHNVLPLSYFEEAYNMMKLHLQNLGRDGGQVFVFSDDLEWVRNQDFFTKLENAVFVDELDTLTIFYYLTLAAEGGIVCSASTFCWWSAYLSDLGRIPDRLVIFPNKLNIKHSLYGNVGADDCGSVLLMPYMTVMTNY